MSRPRLCILSFSNLAYDRRVLREIEAARHDFEVDVIAFGDWTPPDGVRYHPLRREKSQLPLHNLFYLLGWLAPQAYDRLFWSYGEYQKAYGLLIQNRYDLIHANDWDGLPVAGRAALQTGAKVLFDAHEDSLEQQADRLDWRLTKRPYRKALFKKYARGIQRMITVSRGVADNYHKYFGWTMDVIMNAPAYQPFEFHPVDPEHIKIVHHGVGAPQRRVEEMIEMMDHLDARFTLDLILLPGVGYESYMQLLRDMAAQRNGRVRILDPVKPDQLLSSIAQYDVGISFMEAVQQNHLNALPNKFFDFIMAGLMVFTSDLPMMEKIIREHQIGVVTAAKKPEEKARHLAALTTEQINRCKRNALELAKTMNAEAEMKRLMAIYHEMLT